MTEERKLGVTEDGGFAARLDRQKYKLRFRTTLPSSKRAIGEAVVKVLEVVDEVGGFETDRPDLEIALREALANAIIHGNKNHDQKSVRLRCYGAPGAGVLIVIRDEGEGFDAEEIPDPRSAERIFLEHGRGIFLMRELMDHVEHRKGGREVLLYKSCKTGSSKARKS